MLSAWLGQSTWPSTRKPLLSCWRLEPVSGTFICLIMVEGTSLTKKTEHFKWVKICPPCKKTTQDCCESFSSQGVKIFHRPYSQHLMPASWQPDWIHDILLSVVFQLTALQLGASQKRFRWPAPLRVHGSIFDESCFNLLWANRDISAPVPRWLQSIFKIKRLQRLRFDKTVSATLKP